MWLDHLFPALPIERKSEPEARSAPHPRVRISPGERLLRAITVLAGPHAELMEHCEAPWASVTFAGTRHTIVSHGH